MELVTSNSETTSWRGLEGDERALLRSFEGGHRRAVVCGARDSYLAWLVARLARSGAFPRPCVLVTPDEDGAQRFQRDLSFFFERGQGSGPAELMELPEAMWLSQVETSPYSEISPDRQAVMQRMGVLFRLSQGYTGAVLVASAAALRRRVVPKHVFGRLSDLLLAQAQIERDELVHRLSACGFGRTQVVEDPGTFAVRGGILDFFPPLYRYPVRVEFFGDLVESIRLFDPTSQRTLRAVDDVVFHPVRETIRTSADEAQLRQRILQVADEAHHPSSRTRLLLEELEQGREFFGIEALVPALHDQLVSLADYLPADALCVVVDPEGVAQVLAEEDRRAAEGYRLRLEDGRLAFPPAAFFVGAEELTAELARHPRLEGYPTEDPTRHTSVRCTQRGNEDVVAELALARGEKGQQILRTLVARLRRWLEQGRTVLIAVGGKGQTERLLALLQGYGIDAEIVQQLGRELSAAQGRVLLAPGELSAGFRVADGLVVLTETEVFGPKSRRRVSGHAAGTGLGDLGQLREGDAVVHAQHGIGIYQGLKKLAFRGTPADFLLLEYAGGDRLYVPVYRMNLVQQYSGGDGAQPRPDRLGGVTWAKKRGRVRADVRKMAEELLQLYAQRAALQGTAFAAGDALYAEFEATFPFTETPDQLQAIDDVMRDLTSGQPMDRLVCGDVGFGKTEVALRAAFLVAMAGKQVAVLAPTTVLVEQHYRTFAERLAPYPVRVETLSRFRQRGELRQVLAAMAAGQVDIVIGTHRLLQSDVRFHDLGLLVVDEEHRFGVAHKERLKRLRTQVDVLTLTATPIPRTLHLGLMGLRAISIISTPPVDRLAIRTFVCRFDEALVAEAIRKELARGGQVFFVHNRVQSIDEWAGRLKALVPEARVVVGHGQMDAQQLERVMVDFVAGAYDILVSTAIIESGLDIPRANTMFINHADHFGLAQLYQLRGRIGRSRHRAFCYLLVPGFEAMTSEARQRLATLQRFTELGSGYGVASHDLEIRGAGELLGARQSGVIAEVGFETYVRILEEAVAELKGEPIVQEADPELNTHVPAYIPDDYVEDVGQRLDLYKRLSAAARDVDALRDILAEMQDRYGPCPSEVDALGDLMVVKGLAASLGATVVDLTERRVSLTLSEATPLKPEHVVKLVKAKGSLFRLTPEMRLIRTMNEQEALQPLETAKKVLHQLLAHANELH